MEPLASNISAIRKLRERHAFIIGAATGSLAVATLLGGAWVYLDKRMADDREEKQTILRERIVDLDSRLRVEQAETTRLREDAKALTVKSLALQEQLSTALDPARRCAPLAAVMQQKQQIVIDKEARIPSDAVMSPTTMAIVGGVTKVETQAYRNYQALKASVDEAKLELKHSEQDWRGCLTGAPLQR